MNDRVLQFYTDRRVSLTLVPFGSVRPEDVSYLASALPHKGIRVAIARHQQLPPGAFRSARRQYLVDEFLKLARNIPGDRVLALTDDDLFAGNLNFVFGAAEMPGRCAVMSLFRLRLCADPSKFRLRAVKEAVHELGHTFGLSHCPHRDCVMHFSNSLADTDRKGADWCAACNGQLFTYRDQRIALRPGVLIKYAGRH